MRITVMRYPVLPEDGGRDFYIDSFDSWEEANAWIAAQEDKYF